MKISSEGLAHFKHKEMGLGYWVATSKHSTYERDKKNSGSLCSYEHRDNFCGRLIKSQNSAEFL